MAWSPPRTWANGEIVTQTMLNTDVRDNMRELWHQVAYVEFTANVVATVAEATPLTVVSAGAVTYAGVPIIVEVYSPSVFATGAVVGGINLWESTTTDLGRMFHVSVAGGTAFGSETMRRVFTPTAAAHTYIARAWISAGTSLTVAGGAGGAGTMNPGYIRILERGG